MVELPRKDVFDTARQADSAPVAEVPVVEAPAAEAPKKTGRRAVKRAVIAATLLAGVALSGDFGYRYWTIGRFIESTDNAYVKADYTTVAPKVAGYIKEVLVNDNDPVKAGQVLARIDDRDFQAALSQARADVKAAEAAIANIDAQIALQQSVIGQAKATIEASQASLDFAVSDAARSARLITSGAGTQSRAEQSQSARDQAAAAVERDRAALVAAENKVPVLETERQQAVAERDRAAAAARQAELNLSYTDIVAAVDGTLGARSIRVGQYVTSGTQLMAVVPNGTWIIANFKETQLSRIRPGQAVTFTVDALDHVQLRGHVERFSPAAGSEFSVIKPDNATGNFTKVAQRVPVRISIDEGQDQAKYLTPGLSVVVRTVVQDETATAAVSTAVQPKG